MYNETAVHKPKRQNTHEVSDQPLLPDSRLEAGRIRAFRLNAVKCLSRSLAHKQCLQSYLSSYTYSLSRLLGEAEMLRHPPPFSDVSSSFVRQQCCRFKPDFGVWPARQIYPVQR